MKPKICHNRRNPVISDDCPHQYWLVRVNDLSEITEVSYDHAYLLPDNNVWVWSHDETRLIRISGANEGEGSADPTQIRSLDGNIVVTGSGTHHVGLVLSPEILKRLDEGERIAIRIEGQVKSQGNRITVIEDQVADHDNRITTVEGQVADQDHRITAVEDQMAEQGDRLDELESNVETIRDDITVIEGRIPNIVAGNNVSIEQVDNNITIHADEIELFIVVKELPKDGDARHIYLIPQPNGGLNKWAWIDEKWIDLGLLNIDGRQFVTQQELQDGTFVLEVERLRTMGDIDVIGSLNVDGVVTTSNLLVNHNVTVGARVFVGGDLEVEENLRARDISVENAIVSGHNVGDHIADDVIHVTQADRDRWDGQSGSSIGSKYLITHIVGISNTGNGGSKIIDGYEFSQISVGNQNWHLRVRNHRSNSVVVNWQSTHHWGASQQRGSGTFTIAAGAQTGNLDPDASGIGFSTTAMQRQLWWVAISDNVAGTVDVYEVTSTFSRHGQQTLTTAIEKLG